VDQYYSANLLGVRFATDSLQHEAHNEIYGIDALRDACECFVHLVIYHTEHSRPVDVKSDDQRVAPHLTRGDGSSVIVTTIDHGLLGCIIAYTGISANFCFAYWGELGWAGIPADYRDLGERRKLPSGVRDGAAAADEFSEFLSFQNASAET